jgi:hypothetical protein
MFLGVYGDWGTLWEVNVVPVTNYPMFDYFFTLVLVFGVMSWMCGLLFKLITRS